MVFRVCAAGFFIIFFKAADSTKNSTRFIAFALSPQTQRLLLWSGRRPALLWRYIWEAPRFEYPATPSSTGSTNCLV